MAVALRSTARLVDGRVAEHVDAVRVHEPADDRIVGAASAASATIRARRSGSASMRATCSCHGSRPRPAAPHAAVKASGWKVWKPEQQRDGAAVHLRAHGDALGVRPRPRGRGGAATTSGSALFWLSANVTGRPMAAESRRIQSISRSGAARSSPRTPGRGQLEHAGAELAEHAADAEQLVLGGEGAGHGLAVDGPVRERAATSRSRARRPRCRLATMRRHGLDVVGGGRLVARAALAHHVAAHRAVRHLRADVDRVAAAVERVEVLGEASPSPTAMPSDSAAPGMSSTPSIRPMSQSWRSGGTGAKPTPQLPITTVVTPCQHDGVSMRVPGGLAVVVGVDVDEARA